MNTMSSPPVLKIVPLPGNNSEIDTVNKDAIFRLPMKYYKVLTKMVAQREIKRERDRTRQREAKSRQFERYVEEPLTKYLEMVFEVDHQVVSKDLGFWITQAYPSKQKMGVCVCPNGIFIRQESPAYEVVRTYMVTQRLIEENEVRPPG